MSVRDQVLKCVRASVGGLTVEEAVTALGMNASTVRNNLAMLKKAGAIRDSGRKRNGCIVLLALASDAGESAEKTQPQIRLAETSSRAESVRFYDEVRALALVYLKSRMRSLDATELELHASTVAAELDSVLRSAVARIDTEDRRAHVSSSRAAFAAWRALGIDPPKRGRETDAMHTAKKRYRSLVRALHPDLNGGVGGDNQFNEVVRAYALLVSLYGEPQPKPRK